MFEKILLDEVKCKRVKPMMIAIFLETAIITLLTFFPLLFFQKNDQDGIVLIEQVFLPLKSHHGGSNEIVSNKKAGAPATEKKIQPKSVYKPPPEEQPLMAPQEIPESIEEEKNTNQKEEPEKGKSEEADSGSGTPCNTPECVPGSIGEPENKEEVKKPPEKSPPPEEKPKIGGNVKQAKLIHRVEPVYPPLARQSKVEGDVVLEGIIGTDGTIHNLKIVSGHTLLRQSAIDTVGQWEYEPATLNDEPIEVSTTITVKFVLIK